MMWQRETAGKRWSIGLAGLLASLYLALALSASYCQLAHTTEAAGGHHHHAPKAAHSTLCAWACQAVSPALAAQLDSVAGPALAATAILLLGALFRSCFDLTRFAPRGPPLT
jgi:hypothetical protein